MALELKQAGDLADVTDADLIDGGDAETVYSIRHLTVEKHREITKSHTKKVPDKRTHQLVDKVDWDAVSDALYDYVLADWRGVTVNGQAVPCAGEYKALLDGMRRSALLEKAGLNEVKAAAERRSESFRPPADVR